MSKVITFEYRDGGNYKWYPTIKISDEKIKMLEEKYGTLEQGTEILYDSDLDISQEDFHIQRGYAYDDDIDHNILAIEEILSEGKNEPISFYVDCDENS